MRKKEFLDVTVKTGSVVFAPTWPMVMSVKNNKSPEAQAEYVRHYEQLMYSSQMIYRDRWEALLHHEILILGCYCGPNDFCHRKLLAKMIVEFSKGYSGKEAVYMGEVFGKLT